MAGTTDTDVALVEGVEPAEQRRAYVRVAVCRPIRLTVLDPAVEIPQTCRALSIDLSERGARCAVPVDAETAARWLTEGCHVGAQFTLRDMDFAISGVIGSRLVARDPDEPIQVVLHFDQPVPGAKKLRRELFAEQIRQHKLCNGY